MKYKFAALILSVLLLFTGCGGSTEQARQDEIYFTADEVSFEHTPVVYGEMYGDDRSVNCGIDMFSVITEADIPKLNFDNATLISSDRQLYAYVRYCINRRWNNVIVHFTADYGLAPDETELLDRFSLPYCISYRKLADDKSTYAVYSFEYYSGLKAADGAEGEKYDEIRNVINGLIGSDVFKNKTEYEKQTAIAEFVCEKAKYTDEGEKGTLDDVNTAYGALVEGYANCQGYADAFQAICVMADIPCGKVTGTAHKLNHVWNTTKIDGKWYMTDTVWMDTTFEGEIYYGTLNCGTDVIAVDHQWNEDYEQESVTEFTDSNYYYYRNGFCGEGEQLLLLAEQLVQQNGRADLVTDGELFDGFELKLEQDTGTEITFFSRKIGNRTYICAVR